MLLKNIFKSLNQHFLDIHFSAFKKLTSKKKRVIVDIRNSNIIIQLNIYLLFLQLNIIQLIIDYEYIIIINAIFLFY